MTNDILEKLRMRRGLEPDDGSQDKAILAMTPEDMVRELVAWEIGDSRWANRIIYWMTELGAKPENF